MISALAFNSSSSGLPGCRGSVAALICFLSSKFLSFSCASRPTPLCIRGRIQRLEGNTTRDRSEQLSFHSNDIQAEISQDVGAVGFDISVVALQFVIAGA